MDAAAGGFGGAIDGGLAGAGDGIDLGAGGAIDLGPSGTGGAMDAHADIPISGTGGVAAGGNTGGMDGAATGGIIGRTGGATGRGGATGTGGTKATGGTTGTGGTKASGGATRRGGVTGSGGRIGTGGATGTGGTMAPDAGPDLAPDLTPDLSPDTSTLATGLVAYYTCESASDTTLLDVSGNANHGTLSAGVPPDGGTAPSGLAYGFAGGKVGNALVLSKAGYGYVSLPPAIFTSVSTITIAIWVNVTTALAWQRIFDVGINANVYNAPTTGTKYMNLTPRNDNGNLRFSISIDGYSREESLNTTSPATGVWKHVTIVLDAASAVGSLYIDGSPVVTNEPITIQPDDLVAINYAYLGKSQFGADPYFDGMIDEFRVYNRVLSATEIAALAAFTGH